MCPYRKLYGDSGHFQACAGTQCIPIGWRVRLERPKGREICTKLMSCYTMLGLSSKGHSWFFIMPDSLHFWGMLSRNKRTRKYCCMRYVLNVTKLHGSFCLSQMGRLPCTDLPDNRNDVLVAPKHPSPNIHPNNPHKALSSVPDTFQLLIIAAAAAII